MQSLVFCHVILRVLSCNPSSPVMQSLVAFPQAADECTDFLVRLPVKNIRCVVFFCALCECLLMNQAQDARPEPVQIPTPPAVSASMKRDGGAKIASFAPLCLCFGFLRQNFGLASGRFHPKNWPFSPPKVIIFTPESHHLQTKNAVGLKVGSIN